MGSTKMPSEPIEADFAAPPALSALRDAQFRELEVEGPPPHFFASSSNSTIDVAEKAYPGYHLVQFEPGAGEDPREWSYWKKWCVSLQWR